MIIVSIPYYELPGKQEILARCVSSLKGHDHTIIIGKQETLAKAQNMGIDLAFYMGADYVILSNDDVILTKGTLDKLCVPGQVVSPTVHGGLNKLFHAHMFCMPRSVYEKVGGFDETCPGPYYIDSDLWIRLMQAEIPIIKSEEVHIDHPEPARTLSKLNNRTNECREWFINKHGKGYLAVVE